MSRTFHVAFALVEVEGLLGQGSLYASALEQSWVGGSSATRYGRTWLIERPTVDGNTWLGRIGFVEEGELRRVKWDGERQVFETEEIAGGQLVPFALDLETHQVAFQLISGVVKPTTFTGAIQKLLNESQHVHRWQVEPAVFRRSYEEWRAEVDLVTEFSFRLEAPNPHYDDDDQVEQLIESLRVEVARLSGKGRDGGPVDDSAPLFQQALDHVRRQYGHATLHGRDDDGTDSQWDSADGGTVAVGTQVESDAEDTLTPNELKQALRDQADAGAEVLDQQEDETT